MKISILLIATLLCIFNLILADASDDSSAKKKKKKKLPKDPLFITDLDLENLFDEWEESDDVKLPLDELPAYKRPPPPVNNLGDDIFKDPQKLLMASKKGKTVMAFVTVSNNPTKEDTDMLTQRWQVGLTNMHMKCERFVISDDRAIFVFEDGSLAYEAKSYLLDQPELKEYSIDNQTWQGKGYPTCSTSEA